MTSLAPKFAIGALMLIIGLWCSVVRGSPNTGVISDLCSSAKYPGDDPHLNSIVFVLNDVMMQTPNSKPEYNYFDVFGYPSPAFGYGSCTWSLSASDCSTCMIAAFNEIQDCPDGTFAEIILQDCSIAYRTDAPIENTP
ncbi:OLC1v1007942C1 [Oldenlandia corymbosa var. corymbosa]|uniref:OLC1v1007942C1 n=1 Tax=Oldenlandia corymbosa var. corymbosa TaxID=529605 RepID=A0AAV1DMZ4_OLDCO|nr:OLC1v1007942C1 [Oldenlandia corymbosa var. corymbosa]